MACRHRGGVRAMNSKLLTQKQVVDLVGVSRTTIWRLERAGQFPRRRQVSTKAVRWDQAEIVDWINSRPLAGEEGGNE